MLDYNSGRLYEDAFNILYNWKKWLPPDVYRYHELVCKEVNAPVELQMGILLPFISSVCGPLTKGHFLMRPSCLNLFWLNIAASGVGKSQTRKQMISQPLQYILQNTEHSVQDFKVSKYTKAGKCKYYIFEKYVIMYILT